MQAENTPEFMNYINSLPSGSSVELECPYCHKTFIRTKNVIQSKFGTFNNNARIFCSRKCFGKSLITLQDVNCLQCNKSFQKEKNQVIRFPNHFCSHSCAATYHNTHKTKGTRRSKLEKWLEEQLIKLYPDLEKLFNKRETINSELDIHIPSLNLAFELNGIFHYEPIFGSERLASIKNNDNRKFQACLEKSIELVIIDTSKQKYFKEKTAQEYLDIITNIINKKLNDLNH